MNDEASRVTLPEGQTGAVGLPAGALHAGSAAEALTAAAMQILRPLARLLIANDLKLGQAEELLKRAMVEAALEEFARQGRVPSVSTVSVSTGVHRKEAKRLIEEAGAAPTEALAHGRSYAAELYTRWLTDPAFRRDGAVLDLPRRATGEGSVSFEALARSVSTDVHPRTLLDELVRLGLVVPVTGCDALRLVQGGFVPSARKSEVIGLLGANVGDHLETAVANVLGGSPPRLEQSVYAGSIAADRFPQVDAAGREVWAQAMQRLVPLLESLIRDSVERPSGEPHGRVRVGMYVNTEPDVPPPAVDRVAKPGRAVAARSLPAQRRTE
jgi:Family of unknown function (DUF6502)